MKCGSLLLGMAVLTAAGASAARAGVVNFDDQYAYAITSGYNSGGFATAIPNTYAPTIAPGATMSVSGANGTMGFPTTVDFLKYGNIGDPSTNDSTSSGTSPTGINVFGGPDAQETDNISVIMLSFSSPVPVASLMVNTLANTGALPVVVNGYDSSSALVGTETVQPLNHDYFAANTAASAMAVTGFASTPVSYLTVSGFFVQLDDVTVATVPEPASLGLLGAGALLLLKRRKSR